MTPFPLILPPLVAEALEAVAPSMPVGGPHGAMPVLFLLSLISRNPPKQLGVVSPRNSCLFSPPIDTYSVMTCSVENLYSNNHYVMCYGPQDGLSALAPGLPRTQRGA